MGKGLNVVTHPNPIHIEEQDFDELKPVSISISAIRGANDKITDTTISIIMSPYSSMSGEDLIHHAERFSIASVATRILANPGGKLDLFMTALDEMITEEYTAQLMAKPGKK